MPNRTVVSRSTSRISSAVSAFIEDALPFPLIDFPLRAVLKKTKDSLDVAARIHRVRKTAHEYHQEQGEGSVFPQIQKKCSSSAHGLARLFTTSSRRSRLPPARLCIRLPRMRKTRQLPPHHPPSAAGQSGNARRAVSVLLRGSDLSRRCSMDSLRSQ